MTKEQAAEFVRVATMSPEEIKRLNLPPVKWLTRAGIDRLKRNVAEDGGRKKVW
jgi:hypothetical protein